MQTVQARSSAIPSQLAAGKRFGRYKKESAKRAREAEVRETPGLKRLIEAWEKFDPPPKYFPPGEILNHLLNTGACHYDAEDVRMFSIALAEYQDVPNFSNKAGSFLSAVIEFLNDRKVTVVTAGLALPLNFFGRRNNKDVTVIGNLGEQVGMGMRENGVISIDGDVESYAKIREGKIYQRGKLIKGNKRWVNGKLVKV
jgi:hypothetical protein